MKDSFWSIHLDTQSSYLTTSNTHKRCYWFLYMPFGLKLLQDVFQMWLEQITHRLPGIIAIHDDTCMYGKETTEHDRNLPQLMKTSNRSRGASGAMAPLAPIFHLLHMKTCTKIRPLAPLAQDIGSWLKILHLGAPYLYSGSATEDSFTTGSSLHQQ